MKVLLLTTSVLSHKSVEHLNRLYDSIRNDMTNDFTIEHVMLLQNPSLNYIPQFECAESYKITTLIEPTMLSLSEARNRMIKFLKENNMIHENDLIAFPDDDCWYPQQTLKFIFNQFEQLPSLDLFFCKYRQTNHEKPILEKVNYSVSTRELIRNASSNTIFIRGKITNQLDGFDRELGVGAPNNGGEDLDYAIRAYIQADNVAFLNSYIIGHRNKDSSLRGKYFRGSAIVLNRYKYKSFIFFFESIRKFFIGMTLIAKGEITLNEFTLSFKRTEINADI